MLILTAVFLTYAGSLAFIRLRNRAHLPWGRQLTDFSTFMVPFNLPAYWLSKVPTTARVTASTLPQIQALEANWQTIRDEALALYGSGHIATKNDLPASSFYKDNRWKSFYLKVYDHDIPSARQLAPKTLALIEQTPGMNLALFAVLMPGKKLGAHHDPFAYSLRYSLGLSTPNSEQCVITVDGVETVWRDGQSIIFDETYLHTAHNDTDIPRIILMTDIDRPLRWRWVQRAYFHFGRFFNGLFYIDNLDPSITGLGNKITAPLARYKATMRALKTRNRSAYKVGKWTLHIALLGLLVAWAL